MDQKDLFAFFLNLRNEKSIEDIYEIFDTHEISKLDVNRMYRYIDKNYDDDCNDTEYNNIDGDDNIIY